MIRRPPRSTLFPYTTLFRSGRGSLRDFQGPLAGSKGRITDPVGLDLFPEQHSRRADLLVEVLGSRDAQQHVLDRDVEVLELPFPKEAHGQAKGYTLLPTPWEGAGAESAKGFDDAPAAPH